MERYFIVVNQKTLLATRERYGWLGEAEAAAKGLCLQAQEIYLVCEVKGRATPKTEPVTYETAGWMPPP